MILAPLLSAREALAFLATVGLPAVLPALVAFLRRGGLGLAGLGGFLALGRGLLPGGGFLRGGLLRRNVRALVPNGGGFVGGGSFYVLHLVFILFCAGFAHDDPSLRFGRKASQIFSRLSAEEP
jgi:hypothetical protein